MSDRLINADERIDDFEGLKIIQKVEGPHFSIDAILLAKFVSIKKGDSIIDFGTGTGIISLLLASKMEAKSIVAIEIQSELADIARRNVLLNNLESKIEVIETDLRLVKEQFTAGQFGVVVSNPPYRLAGSGRLNPNNTKAIARHEIKCALDDVLKSAFYSLKEHGKLAVVYRPDRLVDLIAGCRRHHLEPKRIQFVYPALDREANLVLLEAIKNGNQDSKVIEPLILV